MPSDAKFMELADRLAEVYYSSYLNKKRGADDTSPIEYLFILGEAYHWAQEKGLEPRRELTHLIMGAQWRFENKFKGRKRHMTEEELRQLARDYLVFALRFAQVKTKEEYDALDYRGQDFLEKMMKMTKKNRERHMSILEEMAEQDPDCPYYLKEQIKQRRMLYRLFPKEPLGVTIGLDERKQLAQEVAAMIEPQLKESVVKAVADALAWREKPVLEKLKAKVTKEAVTLKGRESCIFLEVGQEELMLS